MEIYAGPIGTPLRQVFTFVIPVLVVVNVPARLLAKPLDEQNWPLAGFAIAGHRRHPGRLALDFSAGHAQLPQRQQLDGPLVTRFFRSRLADVPPAASHGVSSEGPRCLIAPPGRD